MAGVVPWGLPPPPYPCAAFVEIRNALLGLDDVQQLDCMPVTKLILNGNGYALTSYLVSKVSLYH